MIIGHAANSQQPAAAEKEAEKEAETEAEAAYAQNVQSESIYTISISMIF